MFGLTCGSRRPGGAEGHHYRPRPKLPAKVMPPPAVLLAGAKEKPDERTSTPEGPRYPPPPGLRVRRTCWCSSTTSTSSPPTSAGCSDACSATAPSVDRAKTARAPSTANSARSSRTGTRDAHTPTRSSSLTRLLAIEDIAIATQVHHYATASGLGTQINR